MMMPFLSQLIQDEIKALVHLQNRQAGGQPHAEFSPTPLTPAVTNTKDYIIPLVSSQCTGLKNVPGDCDSLAVPAHTPFSSPSPPPHGSDAANPWEERATTVLSSGYGTLSAWETGREPAGSPVEDEGGSQEMMMQHWSSHNQAQTDPTVVGSSERPLEVEKPDLVVYQQRPSGYELFLKHESQLLSSSRKMKNLCLTVKRFIIAL